MRNGVKTKPEWQPLYSEFRITVQEDILVRLRSDRARSHDYIKRVHFLTRHSLKLNGARRKSTSEECPIANFHGTQFWCDCYSAPDEVWVIKYCHDEWRLPVERYTPQLQRVFYCVHITYIITTVNDITTASLTEAQKTDGSNLLLAYFLHHRTIVTDEEYHYRREPSVQFSGVIQTWATYE